MRFLVRIVRGLPKPSPDEVLFIPSRDVRRTIRVHAYRPSSSSHKPGPVLVNLHGSGFVLPLHGDDDEFCRLVSSRTQYTVLDVKYRLAPEHPFPAALNDTEDVLRWILSKPEDFNRDRLAISGFSAGANLALAVTSVVFPKDTCRSLIAFYPPCDISIEPELKKEPDSGGKPLPPFIARLFNQSYIPEGEDPKNPRISPRYAPVDRFPKNLLMISCGFDNLALEAEALAADIERSTGHHVIRQRAEKCDHAWDKFAKEGTAQAKAKKDSYDLALEMLKR
jgi:acetyl esterase/lipase